MDASPLVVLVSVAKNTSSVEVRVKPTASEVENKKGFCIPVTCHRRKVPPFETVQVY